jgi:hypothetical protein
VSRSKLILASYLAAASLLTQAHAADGSLSMTVGIDFTSGKYGGNTSTNIFYVPFIAKYETNFYSLNFTLPYIRIIGPGNVVGGINPVVVENESGGRRRSGNGGFEDNKVGSSAREGLGDIIAAASVNVLDIRNQGLLVDLTGRIKFGTADETQGLGTGENDYAFQIDVYHAINRFALFGSAGYSLLGSPRGVNLRNIGYGSIGGSSQVTPVTTGGVVFDFAQATSGAAAPRRDLTAFASFKITPISKFQIYGMRGFSSGSPNYGGGVNYSYSF